MKALKIIGAILLTIIVIMGILGAIAPKSFQVERSIEIEAPADKIFKYLNLWEYYEKWSPWQELDPDMKIEITGTDGAEGSVYSWEGTEKVGKGKMTKTKVEANQLVEYNLHFMTPFESHNEGYMSMQPSGNGYKVSWGMKGKSPFPFNIMGLFYNMDKLIGKDFEKGLNKLKSTVEADESAAYEISEITFEATTYGMIRSQVSFDALAAFFEESYGKIMALLEQNNQQASGSPTGVFYEWNETNQMADLSAAIPVSSVIDKTKDQIFFETIPAQEALLVEFFGNYENLSQAHEALSKKLPNPSLVIEEYITDPGMEPDTAKWLTKIYYLKGN